MKKKLFTFTFFMVSILAFSQVHIIQNNTTSTTILPSSISSTHSSNTLVNQNNLVLGNNALPGIASFNFNNVAFGHDAMNTAVYAGSNVAVGHNSLYWSTYSSKNVSLGFNAMKGYAPSSGSGNSYLDNVAVGYEALKNIYDFS